MPAPAPSTADAILRSARSLVLAGGYNGFSYEDIASVVGIRKASIHHHFPTKVALVRTLVERYRAEVEAGLAALERAHSDPREQLRACVAFWEACIRDDSAPFCVCALLAIEIPVLPEEIVREVRAHFRALSVWVTAVMERGRSQKRLHLSTTPKAEAELFVATLHGAMLSARAHGEAATFSLITKPLLARLASGR